MYSLPHWRHFRIHLSPSSTAIVHFAPQESHLLLTVKPFSVFVGPFMVFPQLNLSSTYSITEAGESPWSLSILTNQTFRLRCDHLLPIERKSLSGSLSENCHFESKARNLKTTSGCLTGFLIAPRRDSK